MLVLSKKNLAEEAESGYEFELTDPATGEGLKGFIKVRGDKSKVVQAFARKRVTELQKRENIARGKNKNTDLTLDELEDMAIESAVVRIISWKDIALTEEEGPLPFTKENATTVLREHSWIRDQIMEASENLLNFRPE